ncbi:MAG: hypothetical protein EPN55_12335 [Gammaproteobacteria bacterium]|nr:MAG: hypothetical protein EPN55_12335 [Gammaproteobacteria bacterium]
MKKLRPLSLRGIEQILDDSYFTKASFQITNAPDDEPFLVISFVPDDRFFFKAYSAESEKQKYLTYEAPGNHMSTGEEYEYSDFNKVEWAIRSWAKRIKEDYDQRASAKDEIEEFVEKLRKQFPEAPEGEFTDSEVENLKARLSDLENVVEQQAQKLKASEWEISQFKKEIEAIKGDLHRFPKPVWYKVAGNKILKAVGKFLTSGEGRQLIVEVIKRLLPPPS